MFENYYKMLGTEKQFPNFPRKTRGCGNTEARYLPGIIHEAREDCL